MSVESLSDEEVRRASINELLPGIVDTDAPAPDPATAYLNAILLRKSRQPTVDRTDETTSALLHCENATPQSLTTTTTTTSTTKTLSGSGNSIGAHRKPSASTDPTSILSPDLSLDKKCVEPDHCGLQDRPHSSTSMRATNGSDTSSSSEGGKRNKKKEPVEWKWNTNGVGSQFSEESSSKHVKVRTIRENVQEALALADIQQQNASMQSEIKAIQSKMAEMESRMRLDAWHRHLLFSLLVVIFFICLIIAWKI